MTLDNGLMANIESDCLAMFHFNEVPKTVGQEVSVTWRGHNPYYYSERYLVLPEHSEDTRGTFEFLGKGWLKGSFGVPGFGVARFVARAKKGTRRGR